MNLMVYAPYGRAGIYLMQEYCRLLGIGSSDKDLKELGDTLKSSPFKSPDRQRNARGFGLQPSLTPWPMHYSIRSIAHIPFPQLYDWLGRCGMSFGRWVEQAPYLASAE